MSSASRAAETRRHRWVPEVKKKCKTPDDKNMSKIDDRGTDSCSRKRKHQILRGLQVDSTRFWRQLYFFGQQQSKNVFSAPVPLFSQDLDRIFSCFIYIFYHPCVGRWCISQGTTLAGTARDRALVKLCHIRSRPRWGVTPFFTTVPRLSQSHE